MKFCVIGAGSGGRAVAAYLSSLNYPVNLYNRSPSRIKHIKNSGGIRAEGAIYGFYPLAKITQNLEKAVKNTDILMVVVPASAHKEMAKKLAPFLTDDQIILLNPGRTFGSVEVSKYIKQQRKNLKVYIAETQTLLFTSRSLEKDMVRIHKIKDSVKFSSFRVNENPYIHKKLKAFFPQLIPAKNYFQLTLNNIGMLLHPSVALLNSGAIETGLNFKFYGEGASKSICKILEKLQTEINQILKKIGLRRFDFCSWAKQVYGESGKNIYDTLQKISVYKGIDAPSELKTRYFTEDVPTGLVPLASLGRFLKIDTPTIDSIIHLSNLICDIDFWEEGRTIEALSLSRILKNRFNLETQIPEAVGERQEFLFI